MTSDPSNPRRGYMSRISGKVRFQAMTLTAGLVIGLGLVAMGTAVEVSSRPQFCGSCHIMEPYYSSWKESSHRNIACVDCHIPPGVTAEVRKKYEALSMVASYFTGTYGTNPWTEIDDSACLKCHERRLLAGKELFGDVLFDHTAHLSGMRRGKKLRCTSCHSQIVQGSHIAVTTSTCILCHFKDQDADSKMSRCTLCHHIPDKVIQHETLTFNHGDVARLGMDCTWCHARPAGSDGAVPRERCVTCHNEQSRLKEYENIDLLHQMHVTEHKVDCTNCHLELEHVGEPSLEQAATSCSTCHQKGHSPQMNLYAGVGGRGVEPMPDVMFLAGVRCEGCHIEMPGSAEEVRKASDVSCMSCHGPSYRKIYLGWKERIDGRTDALRGQMTRTAQSLGGKSDDSLSNARFNLDLVSRGRGVHNMKYAGALLKRAHQDMNEARRSAGLSPLDLPWREMAYESPCLECHQGIESNRASVFGRRFDHEPHLLRAALTCDACHRTHEERAEGEVVRFGPEGCASCHHQDVASKDCLTCHEGIKSRTFATERGDFDHAFHVEGAELTCDTCHDVQPGQKVKFLAEACEACHG